MQLLDALSPLLSLFQPFLDDADAARLLRTSRSTAIALLPGYTFTSHIFEPLSLTSLRRLRDLCLTYRLRITQLCLPEHIKRISFDADPPHLSPIPASVTALTVGRPYTNRSARDMVQRWAAFSAAAGDWQDRPPWRLPQADPLPQSCEEEGRSWQWARHDSSWGQLLCSSLPQFPGPFSTLDCPLPPGLLPTGLRVLLLSDKYSQQLQPGSLPSTLTFLQLGGLFNQPLEPGVLPASLLQLSVTSSMHYHHPLLHELLPASLERLRLWNWPLPLEVGMWPSGLRALELGECDHPLQPHVLPPTLLYLSFHFFNQNLRPHAFPSSLVELHLGHTYTLPLLPDVLPSSLRRLSVGGAFVGPLRMRSLPEGLLFLSFHPLMHPESRSLWNPPSKLSRLRPGVLPSTLLGIDFTDRYEHPIPAGVIPSSARWVRLWSGYRDEHIEAVLPARAEVSWW